MAGPLRNPSGDLMDDLAAPKPTWPKTYDPSSFSFNQLVLLLDRLMAGRPQTGSADDPRRETSRFRAIASLAFPAADIAGIAWSANGDDGGEARLEATVTFLGLYGPASPLSPHVTEQLLGPDSAAMREFLDLFNHRLITLAYRTWKKYRYYANFEGQAADDTSRNLFALIGHQNLPAAAGRADKPSALDWPRLLRFAGVLGLNCRSPSVVEQVVAAYFGVHVRVEEAVERTVTIPEAQQSRIGARRSTIMSDWILGDTLQDVGGKFRIWLGPLDPGTFRSFLPGGMNHQPLYALIRHLARDALDFDVWALPADRAVEGLSLDAEAPLGWATWLGQTGPQDAAGVPLPPASATPALNAHVSTTPVGNQG